MVTTTESLFNRHTHLMTDVIYTTVNQYDTFVHLGCDRYPDEWYNFIVPSTQVDGFDFASAEEVIRSQKEYGTRVSYYLSDELKASYENKLDQHGYQLMADDTYLLKELNSVEDELDHTIEPLSEVHFDSYIHAAKVCFPDWPDNPDWSEYFYNLMLNNPFENKEFKTYVGLVDGSLVSFGSIILDHEAGLGYIHNDGTLESHRRQGFHSALIKSRCNYAFKKGIKDIVSITEKGSSSYKSFEKEGFSPADTYYIFTT